MKDSHSKILTTGEVNRRYGEINDLVPGSREYIKKYLEQVKAFVNESTSIQNDLKKVLTDNAEEIDGQRVEIRIFNGKANYVNTWPSNYGDTDGIIDGIIQQQVSSLVDDLCFFIYVLSRDPDERIRISGTKVARRKELLTSYLQRLEILLEDPNFLEAIQVDTTMLSEKRSEYIQELQDLKTERKRGGQKKILEFPLIPIIGVLDLIGYKDRKKASLLADLIQEFDIPEYRGQERKAMIGKVTKWFAVRLD